MCFVELKKNDENIDSAYDTFILSTEFNESVNNLALFVKLVFKSKSFDQISSLISKNEKFCCMSLMHTNQLSIYLIQ